MDAIQIKIAEPCHENWQNMTATEKGRYCGACKKEVVDFTVMSDAELINYFSTLKEKNICGSALPQQLERPIYKIAEARKPLPWYWNYIMLLLMFFSKASLKAQAVKGKIATQQVKENIAAILSNKAPSCLVIDNNDTIRSKVRAIPVKPDTMIKVETNAEENIKIRVGGLSVSAVTEPAPLYIVDGVVIENLSDVHPNDIESIEVLKNTVATALYGRMAASGVIILTTKKRTMKEAAKKIITTITDTLKITYAKGSLKVYPNPAKRGNTVSIDVQLKHEGVYALQIIDVNGNIVFQQSINAIAKKYTEQIQLTDIWSSGTYFIQIFNSQNKLVNTSRLVVE